MKKFLLFLSMLTIVGCTSANKAVEPTDAQKARLLRLADEKEQAKQMAEQQRIEKEAAVKMERTGEETEEALASQNINTENDFVSKRYDGKTRGEIMQNEMARITDEMKVLEEKVNNYLDYGNKLRDYKEKLDNLERMNSVSIK